jgi:GT2 family glycosyltransferase
MVDMGTKGQDPPSTIQNPKVAVILVNYKGQRDTLECLDSLGRLTYEPRDVILVDQASKDGTPAAVRRLFPWVHVIENAVNNGFTGGNNVGMRAALERGADCLFLLNNDTTVDPGLLEPLVRLAQSDPAIGIVGPKMLYHSDPDIIWSMGGRVDWRGNSRLLGEGSRDAPGDAPRDVDFIVGCGLMVKRDVLLRVGLLDERYFMYYEESDLCARVRKAGYRVVYQPVARLWHKVSRSAGADSELTLYYMRRNVLLYLALHGTRPGLLAALGDALRLAAVWTVQGKSARRRVLLRALGDYLRGRFGKAEIVFG